VARPVGTLCFGRAIILGASRSNYVVKIAYESGQDALLSCLRENLLRLRRKQGRGDLAVFVPRKHRKRSAGFISGVERAQQLLEGDRNRDGWKVIYRQRRLVNA